jgi:hypothetical protein
MGYQPRIKSPRGAIHESRKPLRENRRERKRIHRRNDKSLLEEKHTSTEREISEATLKRLHTLGIQKFGSSPFSDHFDRWQTNVTDVLREFESHPNISVDDQFVRDRSQALEVIKLQLEDARHREATLDQETKYLSVWRNQLKQINSEYAILTSEVKARKKSQLRNLYTSIDALKKEQETVIRLKTGLFRGLSKKRKEQKEIEIAQKLNDKQRDLELVILEFNLTQKQLREEFERKREPVLEQIKHFQKRVENLETDSSLEERWFACEALIDAVNSFLQRKADPAALGPN